jgi:hypothetical protein
MLSVLNASFHASSKILLFKTAKHLKERYFFSGQSKNATARLTPAVAFFCSIGKKAPL